MAAGDGLQPSGWSTQQFRLLYDAHAPAVHRYFAARVAPAAAEDLTATTFLVAWRTRDRFDAERGSPRAWLFGIGKNVLLAHHRETRRQQRPAPVDLVDVGESVEDLVIGRVDAERAGRDLLAHIRQLDLSDRLLVHLYVADGATYQSMADGLGIPIGTVRSRLSRLRTRLQATDGTRP